MGGQWRYSRTDQNMEAKVTMAKTPAKTTTRILKLSLEERRTADGKDTFYTLTINGKRVKVPVVPHR